MQSILVTDVKQLKDDEIEERKGDATKLPERLKTCQRWLTSYWNAQIEKQTVK